MANRGQTHPSVRFSAKGPGLTAYFTPDEVVLPEPGAQIRANGTAFRVRRREADVRILSPVDGEVIAKVPNEGELVPAGFAIFTLMAPSNLWLSLNVREDQFGSLKLGQS